jgi:hypothetical protein
MHAPLVASHDLQFGLRVITPELKPATVVHIFSGSLAGAVEVEHPSGRKTIERAGLLRHDSEATA